MRTRPIRSLLVVALGAGPGRRSGAILVLRKEDSTVQMRIVPARVGGTAIFQPPAPVD